MYFHLRNNDSIYSLLFGFAAAYKKIPKYVLTETDGLVQCECIIGDLKSSAICSKKKPVESYDDQARMQAANNMLKLFDSDPNLKEKFSKYLYDCSNSVTERKNSLNNNHDFKEALINFDAIKEVKKTLNSVLLDSQPIEGAASNSEVDVNTRGVKEPDDLVYSLTNIDEKYSLKPQDDLKVKDFYSLLGETLAQVLPPHSFTVIPVGSFVIGCMTNYDIRVDCYLNFESCTEEEDNLPIRPLTMKFVKDKLEEVFTLKSKSNDRKIDLEWSGDDENTLLVKDVQSEISIRVLAANQGEPGNNQRISRSTAGICHSSWLKNNYNQSQNAWKAIKLFRLIRIWK